MEPRRDDPLLRWLEAERSDRSDEAEAALAELMSDLPRWEPSAGFAERVMLAVAAPAPAPAVAPAAAPRRSPFASLWLRGALGFALAAAALVAALVPDIFLALLQLVSPGRLTTFAFRSLTEGAQAFAAACQILLGYEALGRAAALVLQTPQVAAALAACALVSALSSHLLVHLLKNRSWSHVHTV